MKYISSELMFDTISEWPRKLKWTASIAILCITVALGYYFYIAEKKSYLLTIRLQQMEVRKKIIDNKNKTKEIKIYQRQLKNKKIQLNKLLHQFFTNGDILKTLTKLSNLGTTDKLEILSIKPGAEIKKAFYYELPRQWKVLGNYKQFYQFVEQLSGLEQIISLGNFTIQPLKKIEHPNLSKTIFLSDKLVFSIDAKIYSSITAIKKTQPAESIPTKATSNLNYRDPFQKSDISYPVSQIANSTITDLNQIPCEQFKMVGTIKKKQQRWALIQMPEGKIYSVEVGQTVGSDLAKVININENEVILQKSIHTTTENISQKIKLPMQIVK